MENLLDSLKTTNQENENLKIASLKGGKEIFTCFPENLSELISEDSGELNSVLKLRKIIGVEYSKVRLTWNKNYFLTIYSVDPVYPYHKFKSAITEKDLKNYLKYSQENNLFIKDKD